jgi:O-antigen/teichoic acid export membrane protein
VPFLVQLDRYLIAAIVTVEVVTFYSVPFEVLNGLWIIPGGIVAVLFPVFSSFQTRDDKILIELYVRPIKYILVTLGPIVLMVMIFSKEILFLWQGPTFAEKSALVLQILVIGVLVNSLGWVPSTLLMGLGRPDLTAKIHLLQLPLYLVIAYLLISKWGIVGAAVAFTLRVTIEAALVFGASWWVTPVTRRALWVPGILGAVLSLLVFALVLFGIRTLEIGLLVHVGLVSLLVIFFAGIVWFVSLDKVDKELVKSLLTIYNKGVL